MSFLGMVYRGYAEVDNGDGDKSPSYLPEGIFGFNRAVLNFFTYFLLMSTLIPISLFVSIECKRFLISRWMEVDADMYSLLWDRAAKISNSSVTTDIGQISYLFSDKTGTLTCNEMKFKSMIIGD
jgi:P-type E1-E2 ATPase